MKKHFSRIVLAICIVSGMSFCQAESTNGMDIPSSENTYPAQIQESNGDALFNGPKTNSKNSFANKTKAFAGKMQQSYSNGINGIKTKLNSSKNTAKNSTQPQENDSDTVQNIIPTESKDKSSWKKNFTKQEINNKINNMKNVVKNRKNSKDSKSKLEFKKHSLTDIEETGNIKRIKEQINNEEYFKHDAKNKIYLDRFKTYGSDEEKSTFYKEKNIEETETGDIQLNNVNGRPIDELIIQIEQTDPNENSTPIELTLKESIGIGLAKHPSILSAKLNTDISRSRMIQAWSSYFPTFSAGMNWGYDFTRYHGEDYTHGYNSVYVPEVSAGMLIFDFGKTKANVDIARTDYDASRYDLQDSIGLIIYDIKSAYYKVLFAQKQIEIYNKTIEDFDLQLESAQKYFSIGKKPQIDVLTAEYNAGNARLNLVKANNTLENAKVTFANTLGLPEFANYDLSETLTYEEYSLELETLLQNAFNIRPDLLSYEKSLEAALLAVRLAKRNFTPDLTSNGGFMYSDVEDFNSSNYRVKVDLSYTGFNFMQLKKEYDIAVKNYKKMLADYEAKRQMVYLEVKQAFIDYSNTQQSVRQADLNVKQAKAQHYHATGRYKAGYGDAIEIKDAENTYLNAQLAYYQALLDYNIALAELEKVIGCPIQKEQISKSAENVDADKNIDSAKPEEVEKTTTEL